jgi:hypothetical protein
VIPAMAGTGSDKSPSRASVTNLSAKIMFQPSRAARAIY